MLNWIKKQVIESEFLNVAILTSGVVLSQCIAFLAQPIATRLYSPKEFGIFAIITSVVSTFASSINGQYNLSIISAETDREANEITALSFYIGIVLTIIISLSIILYNIIIPSTYSNIGNWLYITIPFLLITSITNVLSSYNNRFGQYKLMASVSIYRAFFSNIVKIILGLFKIGVTGLILAAVISYLAGVKKQSEFLLNNYHQIISVKKSDLIKILKKYKAQPLFSAPGIFLVSYSFNIIPVFISLLYGFDEVGQFSLSMGMLGLPITLISNNIGPVFFRKASRERATTGVFIKTFKSTLFMLAILSIIPFGILLYFSEPLFIFVFGAKWYQGGSFVKYLIPWYWMNFIVGSLICGLIISGSQLIKIIVQFNFLIAAFGVFYIAKIYAFKIEIFLLTISCAYGAIYFILLIIIYLASKNKLVI